MKKMDVNMQAILLVRAQDLKVMDEDKMKVG